LIICSQSTLRFNLSRKIFLQDIVEACGRSTKSVKIVFLEGFSLQSGLKTMETQNFIKSIPSL
jgi:hypothetical protein